jgi:hypothetical protein
MALSKEQEELLDKVSTDTSHWRYGLCYVYNVFPETPKELVTEEFCLAVVRKNGYALRYVPVEMRTEAVCRAAVENSANLDDVPEKLITEALCFTAVRKEGTALNGIPRKLKTEELCIAAVSQNPIAHRCIPEKLRTEAVYLIVVQKKGDELSEIPKKLRTEAVCIAAVKQNELAINYVPEKLLVKVKAALNGGL